MGASRTIVKETLRKDIQVRPETQAAAPPAGAGRKVGEETLVEITPDRIRVRAYEIYEARNGGPGDAASDWAQAERELNGEGGAGAASPAPAAGPCVIEIKGGAEAKRRPEAEVRGGPSLPLR